MSDDARRQLLSGFRVLLAKLSCSISFTRDLVERLTRAASTKGFWVASKVVWSSAGLGREVTSPRQGAWSRFWGQRASSHPFVKRLDTLTLRTMASRECAFPMVGQRPHPIQALSAAAPASWGSLRQIREGRCGGAGAYRRPDGEVASSSGPSARGRRCGGRGRRPDRARTTPPAGSEWRRGHSRAP
jgi:hypothetical protein